MKLFIFTCNDLEQAFSTNLHFNSLSEKDLITVLKRMKLLREDKPTETVIWQNFYSRLKVGPPEGSTLKAHFDIKSAMIALYFLTSSKPSTKATHIA